jgi:hypothetical protein
VRRSVFIFVALCLLGVSARADQVVLKNGDRITGTIVKTDVKADDKTKTVLVIKTDFAGDIPVLWDSVASVVSGEPLHLQLKDGQTIVGPVTTSNDKLDVATATLPRRRMRSLPFATMRSRRPTTTPSTGCSTRGLRTSGAACSTPA